MGRRKMNPTITLPQLRSLVDMMNNMLLIPTKNKEFIMGKKLWEKDMTHRSTPLY